MDANSVILLYLLISEFLVFFLSRIYLFGTWTVFEIVFTFIAFFNWFMRDFLWPRRRFSRRSDLRQLGDLFIDFVVDSKLSMGVCCRLTLLNGSRLLSKVLQELPFDFLARNNYFMEALTVESTCRGLATESSLLQKLPQGPPIVLLNTQFIIFYSRHDVPLRMNFVKTCSYRVQTFETLVDR